VTSAAARQGHRPLRGSARAAARQWDDSAVRFHRPVPDAPTRPARVPGAAGETGGPVPPGLTGFCAQVTGRLAELARGLPGPLRGPVHALAGQPGKYLRSMMLAACAGFGAAAPERLVRLAALVELLHLASLLHDDVVDQASVRRGLPAAHTLVGNEGAMLAGLSCFALAGQEAAELGEGVARLVGRTVAGLAYGEVLDLERAFDTGLTVPDYLELVRRKTGDLFRLSCLLGAAAAAVPPATAAALATFGADFGVAFQILDDCLDLAAQCPGKPGGTDHLLGLFGAPTLHALRADSSGELARLLLSPSFAPADMPAVAGLVRALGGLDAAAGLATEHYQQAREVLGGLPGGPSGTLLAVCASAWRDPAAGTRP
jgi:heptaprenyl diphosphate synthase